MKTLCTIIILAGLTAACPGFASAQDTREAAVANMRKVEPKEMDPAYNKKAPLAQKMVDDALAAQPEVILMAIHAGAPKYDIIASNFGRIGKLGDEDDLRCIRTGKNNLEVDKTGKHFEAELPLKDKPGTTGGARGGGFNYRGGADRKARERTAERVGKPMTAQAACADS